MQVVLIMFRSDGERRSFSIVRDMTVIGRREDCDLRIPLGEVSRKHCRLIKDAETVRLEDLGSSNGTHHNGQRIQEAVLNPGDTIQVGPVTFVVQIDGVPADEDLQPAVTSAAAGSDSQAGFVSADDPDADADAPSEHAPESVPPPPPAQEAGDETDPEAGNELLQFDLEETSPQDHPAAG